MASGACVVMREVQIEGEVRSVARQWMFGEEEAEGEGDGGAVMSVRMRVAVGCVVRRCWARRRPTKPLAPVMRIFMVASWCLGSGDLFSGSIGVFGGMR